MARRRRVEPTEEWAELELLREWPEQVEYERIRPPVVFVSSVAERSRQTGTPQTTLRRRIASFEKEGMRGLFEREPVEGKSTLPPEVQRLILDLNDVEYSARTCRLREVNRPRLFETAHRTGSAQPRLFELAALGKGG